MIEAADGLPPDLQAMIVGEIDPGERVVWSGQPIASRLARKSIPIVLFGIPWTAFAIFWVAMASLGAGKANAPGPFFLFPLFGVPFILIGVGMLTSPFWMRRSARRTAYVLTDRRAIVFQGGLRSIAVRSFEPESLTDLERRQFADGSGDLIFARDVRTGAKGRTNVTEVGFLAIPDVKAVEAEVRALADSVRPS
jgi:hypothetical protein